MLAAAPPGCLRSSAAGQALGAVRRQPAGHDLDDLRDGDVRRPGPRPGRLGADELVLAVLRPAQRLDDRPAPGALLDAPEVLDVLVDADADVTGPAVFV